MENMEASVQRLLDELEEELGQAIETVTIAAGASGEVGVKVHSFDPEVFEQFLLTRLPAS